MKKEKLTLRNIDVKRLVSFWPMLQAKMTPVAHTFFVAFFLLFWIIRILFPAVFNPPPNSRFSFSFFLATLLTYCRLETGYFHCGQRQPYLPLFRDCVRQCLVWKKLRARQTLKFPWECLKVPSYKEQRKKCPCLYSFHFFFSQDAPTCLSFTPYCIFSCSEGESAKPRPISERLRKGEKLSRPFRFSVSGTPQ